MLHLPELPFADPVLVFAVAMAVFLLLPRVFERARVPGLIGLILAGAAIGPNGLGVLERDATIVLLGTVGLLYLMFLVGLELDLDEFDRHRRHSVTFGFLSFALPQATGTVVSLALGYPPLASILLGAMFASHTLVAYPIVSRLGIVRTPASTTVLGATLLTDLLALFVLAVVTGVWEGDAGPLSWLALVAVLAAYVAAVLLAAPRLARWYFRRVGGDGVSDYVFVLAMLFGWAAVAETLGIEAIIGALLVGFALNRLIPERSPLMSRIKFTADAIFVPFFLVSVGMLVDWRAFAAGSAWATVGALVVGTVASKAAAAAVTRHVFGFDRDDGRLMFGLSVSHAAATMAITLIGFEIGLFDETIVNAIVVVILVTCLVGPWVVERSGRRIALREERRPVEGGAAPHRVLVPLANPRTSDALLDLAIGLRPRDSGEPLHPLMVVGRPGREATEPEVAAAERLLGHAVQRAVDAGVPVVPLTRVDVSVSSGILRGITETRSSVVVLGWDGGRPGGGQRIFGGVLDRVIEQSPQQIVVARLGHPLATTKRMLLVLPPAIDRHPGIYDAFGAVKRLASHVGATVTGLVVGEEADLEACAGQFDHVRPALPASFERVESWSGLLGRLRSEAGPDDLVVLLSSRRATLSWHPKLERLPLQLAGLVPESFLVLYPSRAVGAAPAGSDVPAPDHVIRLDGPSFATAMARLARLVVDDRQAARRLRRDLVASERLFSNEIVPGVLLPHARLPGLREPVLALGISPEGVAAPGATEPAHLIFLLVSPRDRPQAHLRRLADMARFLKSPERLAEVLRAHAPELEGKIQPKS